MTTQNIFDLVDTWNNGATTFTAIKMDVTNTASNAASLLMDLQVGTVSRFNVKHNGDVTFASTGGTVSFSGSVGFDFGTFQLLKAASISFGPSNDVVIGRRTAANIRLGSTDTTGTTAPTAQFLSAQSWASSTTNNQTGANFTIDGSQGTGTGAGGSIVFRVAPAGGTGNGVQNGLAAALTIDSTKLATFASDIVISGSTPKLYGASTGSTRYFGFNFGLPLISSDYGAVLISAPSGMAIGSTIATTDAYLSRRAAANLQLGEVDAATPVAQTLSVQSRTGTDAAATAYPFTITGSQGTGTAAGGSIIFQVAPAGGTSNAVQNTLATALTINSDQTVTFASSINGSGILLGVGGNIRTKYVSTPGNTVNMFTFEDTGSTGNLVYASSTTSPLFRFAGTTSSFPALKRSTTFLQARLADDTAFAGFASANMQAATAYTVATLPGTPGTGMIARVTDALAPTIGMTVAAGGAAYALVNYNGANWTVIGV